LRRRDTTEKRASVSRVAGAQGADALEVLRDLWRSQAQTDIDLGDDCETKACKKMSDAGVGFDDFAGAGEADRSAAWRGRLEREGVITGHAPAISPAGLGFTVLAFVHLYLAQGQLDNVVSRLNALPEVLEAHTTTGEGDLLCRVAARSNLQLEEIVQTLLALPGVTRTRTEISLNQRVGYRVLPLVQQMRTAQSRRQDLDPGA